MRYPGVVLLLLILAAPAFAADATTESWPEIDVFKNLNDRFRIFLGASYAKGLESKEGSLDAAGYLDVSLKPAFRASLRQDDWQRKRFLWTRLGYVRISKVDSPGGKRTVSEDRLVASLYARVALPAEIMAEGRVRTDFRWMGGEYSTRHRLRIEVNHDYRVLDHAANAYVQTEWFYDTRYDGWSRYLYQVGTEIELTRHFRVEPYVARQNDRLPSESKVNAIGMVAKWYY